MIQLISSGSVSSSIRNQISQELSQLSSSFDALFTEATATATPSTTPISEQATNTTASILDSSIVSAPISILPSSISDIPKANYSSNYSELTSKMSEKYGVPEKLIQSVIRAESDYNPDAVSSAGAMGLMQLMPKTAEGLGVTDAFNPEQNIEGGTKLLKQYIDKYGDLKLVLAAYNAGPGAVAKYDGVPPYKETEKYIEKVLGNMS